MIHQKEEKIMHQLVNDEKERAIWQTYDDFAVRDHTRILPRYLITFKRTKKVFVWVHENTIILNARLTGKQVITSIGYCGDALYRNKNLACGDIGFIDDIAKTVANVNERIKKTQGKDVYVAPVLLQ